MANNDDNTASSNDEGYEPQNGNGNTGRNGGGLSSGAPAVAAAPGKMMLILVAAVLGIGFVVYSLFSEPEVEVKKVATDPGQVAAPDPTIQFPAQPVVETEIPIPDAPEPPPKTDQVLVPPPPPPPPPDLGIETQKPNNEALQARLKSQMMVLSGKENPSNTTKQDNAQNALSANDPNAAFANNVSKASTAQKVTAGFIGNTRYMIAQGKIIHAVLETAINSDLPGSIRAIVSRDIFAEAGSGVMIPKGSRLIGVYNSAILRGQARVFIVWSRVIRPDGIDIMIDSPGIDSLGRAGKEGHVDNKILEAYSGAFLSSMVTFGVAYAGQKIVGDKNSSSTTTTNNSSDGATTTNTSTPSTQALNDATANIGAVTTGIVGDLLDLRPTISIDQGTEINVFVNKDLLFPPEVLAQTKILQ